MVAKKIEVYLTTRQWENDTPFWTQNNPNYKEIDYAILVARRNNPLFGAIIIDDKIYHLHDIPNNIYQDNGK
jgi:hypothetical protein